MLLEQNSKEQHKAYKAEKLFILMGQFWLGNVALAKSLQCLHWTQKEDGTGIDFKINRSRPNPNAHKLIVAIKSNRSFFPKKELEAKMKG
jgi:hypothetical protein